MIAYRDILAAAWNVAWRRPWLWLLGLLAATLGNGGEYQLLVSAFDRLANPTANWWWPGNWTNAAEADSGSGTVVATVLILAVLCLVLWVAVRSIAALFSASDQLVADRPADLRTSWTSTRGHFWSVLGLVIIGKGLTVILLMAAVAPLVLAIGAGGGDIAVLIAGLLSFIIFVPLSVIISFATKYGIAYVVLEKQRFGHALVGGWKLFWKNWLVSIEVALILFAIGLGLSIALVLLSMVILILVLCVNTVLGTVGVPVLVGATGFTLLRLLAGVIVLPVILISGAMLAVFQTAAWTMVFRHVTSHGLLPKLLRMFRRSPAPAVTPKFVALASSSRRGPRPSSRSRKR